VPDIPTGGHVARRYAPRTANLSYGGGPVLHSNRSHVIFWEPSAPQLSFEAGYEALVKRFLGQVALDSHMPTNVYGLSGQYRDAFGPAAYNSAYQGWVLDTAPLPPNGCQEPSTGPGWSYCVTDAQLEQQLEEVVTADHLPRRANDIYFIVTPNGLGNCIDASSTSCALGGSNSGYCGYHSQTLSGLLYAVIPYNAVPGHCQSDNPRPNNSTADPTVSTISHEHNETVTDPLGTGWIDGSGNEDGDLCIQQYGPTLGGSGAAAWNESIHGGHYYLQEEWSNVQRSCQPRAQPDSVSVGAPARAGAGTPVRLIGHARDRNPGASIAAFRWFFGDGRTSSGRTPKHTFTRAGSYTVLLRVTDSWGNRAFARRTIRVTKARAKDHTTKTRVRPR
jgi:hypothetical protein